MFGAPAKLLSDHVCMNFTSTLVEGLCSAFGIQKCRTTACTMCNAMDRWKDSTRHAVPNDWKVGCGQEGSMGTTPPRTSAGLQQYPICCHGVLTPLSHVREVTSPPCRLFLPHDWCKYKSLSCCHLCGRGTKAFQRGLC